MTVPAAAHGLTSSPALLNMKTGMNSKATKNAFPLRRLALSNPEPLRSSEERYL